MFAMAGPSVQTSAAGVIPVVSCLNFSVEGGMHWRSIWLCCEEESAAAKPGKAISASVNLCQRHTSRDTPGTFRVIQGIKINPTPPQTHEMFGFRLQVQLRSTQDSCDLPAVCQTAWDLHLGDWCDLLLKKIAWGRKQNTRQGHGLCLCVHTSPKPGRCNCCCRMLRWFDALAFPLTFRLLKPASVYL